MIVRGEIKVFRTIDSELKAENGKRAKVLRPLTSEEADIFDVGPMYKVEFEDGLITDVFEDELKA